MGLAESVPYVGMRLVSLQQEDILQIYLMRQLLEPLAAGEACRKITKAQIDELENIQEEYIRIVEEKELDAKKTVSSKQKIPFCYLFHMRNGQSLWSDRILMGYTVIFLS